jgi:vacuolar-type H+-ATPase subunit F/Vma7
MFLFYISVVLSSGGVNPVTLPWITIMTVAMAFVLVFAVFGRYILPVIFRKLGIKIPIGDGYIDDKYFIIVNFDTETGEKFRGFSVIKLIPTTPSVDLKDEDKKLLQRNVESLILALPANIEFGIIKITDPMIKKLLNKLEQQIQKLQRPISLKPGQPLPPSQQEKIAELQREKERIYKSNPVTGIMYIKVFAKGQTENELKNNLKQLIEQVETSAHSLQAFTKVLRGFDLFDFIEQQMLSQTIRHITGT